MCLGIQRTTSVISMRVKAAGAPTRLAQEKDKLPSGTYWYPYPLHCSHKAGESEA